MKRDRPRRPVRPVDEAAGPRYPTEKQEGVTRRAFFGAALAGGAALALDAVAVDPAQARGHLRGKRRVVTHPYSVPLPKPYTCPRSHVKVLGVNGRSQDKAVAAFLSAPGNQRALRKVVLGALRAHRRERLDDGRVRARVIARIRKDFLALYKSRTGKRAYWFTVYLRLKWPGKS